MIYTTGHTANYMSYFAMRHPDIPKKLGRSENYAGGSVWATYEEAKRHCPLDYSVFGVDADWSDTERSQSGDWNDLLIDADLVILHS